VKIECEVYRDGQLLVSGYTVHACINMKTGRPARPPEFVHSLIENPETPKS